MSRKHLWGALAFLLVLSMVLTACGGAATPAPAKPAAEPTAAPAAAEPTKAPEAAKPAERVGVCKSPTWFMTASSTSRPC